MGGARGRTGDITNAEDNSHLREHDREAALGQRSTEPAMPIATEVEAFARNRLTRSANDTRKAQLLLSLQRTHGNTYVQRLISGRGTPVRPEGGTLPDRINARRGGGTPLPPDTRMGLEAALGADLSGVHLHTDGEANQLAQSVEARAFTSGQDIFLGTGAYNPNSDEGQRLLAHEAVHTIQQAAGPVAGSDTSGVSISDPADLFEREATRIADIATHRSPGGAGEPNGVVGHAGSRTEVGISPGASGADRSSAEVASVPRMSPSTPGGAPTSAVAMQRSAVVTVQRETPAVVTPAEAHQRAQNIHDAFHEDHILAEDEQKALAQIRGQSPLMLKEIKAYYERELRPGRTLVGDFEKYCSSSEYKAALMNLGAALTIEDWLRANVNRGWIFDTVNEEGMLQVLRLASRAELDAAAKSPDVMTLLDWALDDDEMFEARKLLTPSAIYELVIERVKDAEGRFNDDEAAVYTALLDLTPAQRYRIWTEQWDIFDEFLNGNEKAIVKRMCVNPEGTGPATEAQALNARMDEATAGAGTDDPAVKLVVERTAAAAKEERAIARAIETGKGPDGTPLTPEQFTALLTRQAELGGIQKNLLTAQYEGGELKEDTFLENLHGDIDEDDEYPAYAEQMGVSAFELAKQQILDAIGTFNDDEESIYKAFDKLVGAIEVPLGQDAAKLTADERALLQREANQKLRRQLLADVDVRTTLDHYLNDEEMRTVETYVSGDTYRIALQKLAEAWEGIDADEEGIFKILTGMSAADRKRLQEEQPQIYRIIMGPNGLNEADAELARVAIVTGHIPTEMAIEWAVDGLGTEDPMIAQSFEAMSEAERYEYRLGYFLHKGGQMPAATEAERQQQEQALAKFRKMYDWLKGDLGTDDLQEALDKLLGRAPTLQELRTEQGRVMAAGIMQGRISEKGDIREQDAASSAIVDYFSESGEVSDQAEARFAIAFRQAMADNRLTDEEFAQLAVLDADFARTYSEYVATVNMVADIASTVAAVAVGIIATLASGGTLGPAAAAFCAKVGVAGTAAIAGTVGAAAKVGVSELVGGEHFDTFSSEGATTAVVGFTEAASAVLAAGLAERFASLVGLGRVALATEMTSGILQAGEASLATVGKTIAGGAFRSTIEGFLAGAVGEMVLTAADEKTWKESIWGVIQRFGWAVIKGGTIGGGTGLITGGAFETLGVYLGTRRLGRLLTELDAAGVTRARLAGLSKESAQVLAQVDALLSVGKVDEAEQVIRSLRGTLSQDELNQVWRVMGAHHKVQVEMLTQERDPNAGQSGSSASSPDSPDYTPVRGAASQTVATGKTPDVRTIAPDEVALDTEISEGSNYGKRLLVFKNGRKAIFKPAEGENPKLIGPDVGINAGEKYRRAPAAAQVAKDLEIPALPTELVRYKGKVGSLQDWLDEPNTWTLEKLRRNDPRWYDAVMKSQLKKDLDTFDYLIANLDRNPGNFMVQLDADGKITKLTPIDMDITFPPSDLRYSMGAPWEPFQMPLPDTISRQLEGKLRHMHANRPALRRALGAFLADVEINGTLARLDEILLKIGDGTIQVTP